MASEAKKLPSGRWRAQGTYYEDGKRRFRSFTADTKREAKYMADEFEHLHRTSATKENWTLGEAIDHYIELQTAVLSPTTIAGYRKVRRYAFQSLIDTPISQLTDESLSQAVSLETRRIGPSGRPLSAKTIRNEYGLISAVLARYRPDRTFRVTLPKQARRIRSLPEPENIYNAVRGTKIELPCLLAMWLSFSESEIRGLTKSKSLDGEYITIREVVVYDGGKYVRKDVAKTSTRIRRHKIPPYIRQLIDQVDGDVLVPMLPCNIYRNLQVCLEKAGLPRISFHDLRHVNASVMAMLHIPDKYAQERGGWASDHIMKTVYTETFSRERQEVDQTIDDYFCSFIG